MKDIEQLAAKVKAFEQFLKEAQAELTAAMKENYREKLKAQKMEDYEVEYEGGGRDDVRWNTEDDPLYSEEAANDMRAHTETRMYLTADGKQHWYLVSEYPQEYQGA